MKNLYLKVFSTPEGQKVLADLFHRFGWQRHTTFSPVEGLMAFREGQREVVRFLQQALQRGADYDPLAEGPATASFHEQETLL